MCNSLTLFLSVQYYALQSQPSLFQWPSGLMRGSAASRLLGFGFQVPPGAWMSVCCERCVLPGRALCDEPIARPEESYRLLCVIVCDIETLRISRLLPVFSCCAREIEIDADNEDQ